MSSLTMILSGLISLCASCKPKSIDIFDSEFQSFAEPSLVECFKFRHRNVQRQRHVQVLENCRSRVSPCHLTAIVVDEMFGCGVFNNLCVVRVSSSRALGICWEIRRRKDYYRNGKQSHTNTTWTLGAPVSCWMLSELANTRLTTSAINRKTDLKGCENMMAVALRAADGISKMWQSNILSSLEEKRKIKTGSSPQKKSFRARWVSWFCRTA